MKRIGIGLSDFKHLIEEDFYYFDKTKFIDEIIQDGAQVKLFTRPRRFGKTLNMSMLKYFFDIKEAEENRRGNVKFDLNVGLDNTRYGVTANIGYDTKGENQRGGLGLRVIF